MSLRRQSSGEVGAEAHSVHPVHPPETSIATADKYLAADMAEARHHAADQDLLNQGIPIADKDLAGYFPPATGQAGPDGLRDDFPVTHGQGGAVREAPKSAQERAEDELLKDVRMPEKH
ncbi:uncharacterized protein LOC129597857 [Paramacrobiotus metropolitanus]|uniref:uncharacterized protein LOC129597857 n=1 Tax=Paramacrobiotus metropolitanus TaxID=2943436 RepID=UPI0024464FE2|nr:uncharacterized protein LOC129597857 [Paramacrobiotus metropolitanus]XP_055351523.1 uncharacterized protein LOC129597857 [Paramacrobiotus metropolitanus]XP_055351524.1 uncharacterized protein LOC129597857 [Paramacrobiotus metropolitanus]XP_055351526.1 uncharacterized protein LOC129597857 [Paramacrobiotus metropolitanus]